MENNNSNSTKDLIEENMTESTHVINLTVNKITKNNEDSCFIRNKKGIIEFSVLVLITSYAIWATIYFIHNTDDLNWTSFNETTSTRYGLLVILYLIYIYCNFYYYLIKPFCLPLVNKFVWKPVKNFGNRIKYGSWIFYILIITSTVIFLWFDTKNSKIRLRPLIGLTFFLLLGFVLSANHRHVPVHTIAWGIISQFAIGFLTIRWTIGRNVLQTFSDHVNNFLNCGVDAAAFTYGDLLVNKEQVFAFRALSVIFFMGFVINLLYYYGLMQRFIIFMGECLQYILGTTICESVNSIAIAFVGMSEGPMMLKPYLKHLTDSELHSLMLAGFASVSGSTFAAYITYGARPQDLVTASIMSAPSALCFSKLLYPETEQVKIKKNDIRMVANEFSSAMDAASRGAIDAFHLISAIISGVTATLAFVYFINGILTWLGILVGFNDTETMWTLEYFAGKIFIPLAWIMGVEWDECEKVGQLIGIKTMVNEFVAFSKLKDMNLSSRSSVIATYAICGFSNPGSIGIQISTMVALEPLKKENVSRLIFRAFIGGALVCFMTACIAGILITDNALNNNNNNSSDHNITQTRIINNNNKINTFFT